MATEIQMMAVLGNISFVAVDSIRAACRGVLGGVVLAACLLAGGVVYAETMIKIHGLESKSRNQVMQLMGDRLVYVREKPASASRANDAAFLVEQILENNGYSDVEVRSRVLGPDQILLTIKEGRRLSLGEVKIEGDGDHERLAKLYALPAEKSSPLGAGSAPFREEDVGTGLKYLKQELQAEGYWNAEVNLRSQDISESGAVNVVIIVDQGARFKIGRATVKSDDGRGLKRVATTAAPFIGQWATTEQVNSLRAAVTEAFISRGYPDAKMVIGRRLVGATYFPEVDINLGVRVKLLDVDTVGLVRTDPNRVKEIMKPLEGDWYDQAAMNEKVKDFLATGAFSSVRIETKLVANKRINATLHMEEARAKEVSLGIGAGSFNGPLLRAGYIDRNFMGDLKGFSAGLEVSGRGLLGEVKLTDPWWLGSEVLSTLRLYSLIRGFDGYQTTETGLESKWVWDVTEHYKMDFMLGYSYVDVEADGLPGGLLGETSYGHARMAFTQSWDYRDSPILPKSGWHVSVPIQFGAALGDETSTYTKFEIDGGWYHPLGKTYQLGIGGFAKWVVPSGDIQDLPVDLRVFNGGARSVRSYPERELGPTSGGDPYGGEFSWAVNTELSRSVTNSVAAVAFVDAGAVTGSYTGSREGGLELAAGLGVRFDLPIGPVRLEYGHNLTKDGSEPVGTWHFAIGATF
ncbi:MAG: BamA/TamA family outer membrane protein [Armatimonadetes bacterium]|nr:BamA/TamA family outer membrane protein [Akkermansiaceae bacterium]